jgi:hypothetical protein
MIDSILFRENGNRQPTGADLALLNWVAQDYKEQQERHVKLRDWYNGDHDIPLTDRQKEYLSRDPLFPFSVNYLRRPVNLCVERLEVEGFDAPAGIGGKDGLLMQWWEANRMDGLQKQVIRSCAVDGDTYVLIEWDEAAGRPAFYHEPAWDGSEGVKIHYVSNMRREMTFASKRWTELNVKPDGKIDSISRLNIYTPTEVKRYKASRESWELYEDGQKPAVESSLIGVIPVVHFRWRDSGVTNWGESEIKQLIPIQELINKSVLDELEVGDNQAFQRLIISGMQAPADPVSFSINDVLFIGAQGGNLPAVTVVPPGDLAAVRGQVEAHITRMAQLSEIPRQYFMETSQVASGDTQRADDSMLVAKVRSESVALGNAWEDVMRIALKYNAEYGSGPVIDDDERIVTQWAEFSRVDPLAAEMQRANIVKTHTEAGASYEGAVSLPALGYTKEEISKLVNLSTAVFPEEARRVVGTAASGAVENQ